MAHIMTVCRLCSTTEDIFDVFHSHLDNGEQLRFSILLATGIQIKETDLISKMVCHRCCEIALKLRKYRTNAVANDKLLKEKAGHPYTPPIVDQDELLLAARATLYNTKSLYASLELLNVSIKKDIDASEAQLPENGTVSQPAVDSKHVGVSVDLSSNQSLTSIPPTTTETSTIENRTILSEDVCTGDKIVNSVAVSVVQNLSSKLLHVPQNVDSSAGFSEQCKGVPKVKYKHPSVRKLFDMYASIVLPEKVFKYDISPVISLDSAEVSDWYREQLRTLEQKLPNINIKKIPKASNNAISSSPLSSTEHSNITSSKHSACEYNIRTPSPITHKMKRNYRRVVDSSDSDKDEEEYQPFNNHQKNDISKINLMTTKVPLNQEEAVPPKDVKSNDKGAKKGVLEEKLPNITIKKIPNASNNAISSSPLSSTEHSNITSSKHGACEYNIRTPSPITHKMKRNYRRVVDSSDSDKDVEEYQPSNSHQKNDISKINLMTTKVPLTNQEEAVPPKDVKSNAKCAKKPNGRCSYVRRKHILLENDDIDEIIPEKKKRVYNESTFSTRNKVDSPRSRSSNKKEQTLLSLLLKPTPVPQDHPANIDDTFLCRSCNKLYDTEREFLNHEKHHLRCKFCKRKMKNVVLLNKHQNETCSVNIVNNQPSIEAMKVDSIPSIVEKYAKAFRKPDVEERTLPADNFNCNEFIDYSELGLNMDKAETPVPSNELVIELEESIANQYFTLLEDFEKNNNNGNVNGGEKLLNEISQNSEVICLSDGSDNEIECISGNKAVAVPSHQLDSQLHATSTRKHLKPKINLPLQSNLSESEIIHSMFKTHYSNSLKKCENGSQTLIGANNNIKFISTSSSNTKLNNIFKDLFDYKIPIHLKSQPGISVEFKSVSISKAPTLNYSWAYKKIVDLEKHDAPKEPVANRSPKNPNVTHSRLQSPPNYYASMSHKHLSNGAHNTEKFTNAMYPAQPPEHNFNNVFKAPGSNVNQTQPIAFKQSVSVPNTAAIPPSSYRMPIVPVNKTSVAISSNQDNVFYDQPEQLFYNNQNVKVNNYFMLPNGVQPTSSINNEISYLNNTNTVAAYEKYFQRCNFETTNQNINLTAAPTDVQVSQNSASMLRVKNIQELS